MEWSNPRLVDLRMGGIDAERICTDGGGPAKACQFGGSLNFVTCHGGGEIQWEVCMEGSSA